VNAVIDNLEDQAMGIELTHPILSQKMDIVIHSMGMPFNGETILHKSLGGSESAGYYLARELARRGHRVKCFTSCRDPKEMESEGVNYIWHGELTQQTPLGERFEHYARNTPHDVLIIQRHPAAFHGRFAAKICIWQLHDLAIHRSTARALGGTWQIDAITVVSDWHAEQIKKVWGFNPDSIFTVPNGVDPSIYKTVTSEDLEIKYTDNPEEVGRVDEKKLVLPTGKFVLLFQSRPERGLANALQLMEQAEKIGLPVHLVTCAYDNKVDHMRDYYGMLEEKARSLKNVTVAGSFTKRQLAKLQMSCDLMLYPTEFEEVSCITAMESMHAMLPMMTSQHAALPETCENSGTILIPMKDGKADLDEFEKKLVNIFGLSIDKTQYPAELTELRKAQLSAAQSRTWSNAADKLLDVVATCYMRRASDGAILRSAIEKSDIIFAEWYLKTHADPGDAIVRSVKKELEDLYDFTTSQEKYAAHYSKHQGVYYDEHEEKVIGEDVTGSSRFVGVQHFLAENIQRKKKPLSVLDYGCAHGHYLIPLAKRFPQCEFVGIDISQRAINAAKKWAEREGLENVQFFVGDQESLLDRRGEFDVVIAGEVLEHVRDYLRLLNLLRDTLVNDGCVVITTPVGRWEHSGTVAFRTGREHLHHFDRQDLEEIFYGHDPVILSAPAGQDRSGFELGSWVTAVYPKTRVPFWSLGYEGKLARTVPHRQTVSACMIVKDGEKTLRRCVESFIDWVDEVIIMIDPATKDRTLQIAAQLAIDFPHRAWTYRVSEKSALKDGFDEARNESIESAAGDWIMWVDADEEIRHPWNLHKFLRCSMHNGFGFAQVHYSVDPDQVLTTDFPCRLFRNKVGVKFYGVVHEHPEVELGKAVPYSIVRPEVKFLHHGYYDEATRRERYHRNLPLLMRDVAKYQSSRPLNKFLWLRDIAQSIQFDAERRGSQPEHVAQAMQGIRLMEEIAEMPQLKMISDAMPYYSLCVATTGGGFDAEVSMKTLHSAAPDLAVDTSVRGRFHDRKFYLKIVNKFSEEMTKHYEDRYL